MSTTFDAETAGNNEEIEMQFAVQTVEHLEAYEKILKGIPPSKVKFTPIDDEIYSDFLEKLPEYKFDDALRDINEDEMKSVKGKERWRAFIMPYEKKVNDYNMGTMVRKYSDKLYDQDNCILVTRIQFFAIEIARNRAGLNVKVYEDAQAAKSKS